jgi:hypothetical protein
MGIRLKSSSPASSTARQRLYLQRQRSGLIVLPIPVHEHTVVGRLLDTGMLTEDEALNRHKVTACPLPK